MDTKVIEKQPGDRNDLGKQIAVIKTDMDKLQGDFGILRHELADDASKALKKFGKKAGKDIKETSKVVREASRHGKAVVLSEVRQHPLTSVAIGTIFGLIAGALAMWAQTSARP